MVQIPTKGSWGEPYTLQELEQFYIEKFLDEAKPLFSQKEFNELVAEFARLVENRGILEAMRRAHDAK